MPDRSATHVPAPTEVRSCNGVANPQGVRARDASADDSAMEEAVAGTGLAEAGDTEPGKEKAAR